MRMIGYLVHYRKTGALPVLQGPLVVHLRCGDPAVADASLDGLDGTLLFQGLSDKSRPGGVRPDPFGQFGFFCIPHKKVVHLLPGQRIVRLSVWLLFSRQYQRGFPLVFVSEGLQIFFENNLQLLMNSQAISFSALDQKIQNKVTAVFIKIFDLERTHLADPAARVKENVEDRLVAQPLEFFGSRGVEHFSHLLRSDDRSFDLAAVHMWPPDSGGRISFRHLPFAQMLEDR